MENRRNSLIDRLRITQNNMGHLCRKVVTENIEITFLHKYLYTKKSKKEKQSRV